MAKSVVAMNSPIDVDLVEGQEYHWCRCGRSKHQPFCDGSHKGTGITPLVFKARDTDTVSLCRCKQTHNAPYCDGHHSHIPDDMVGKEYPPD
ncbi:MAG TPA: CDGSH iron-sulfur domain-containing protein [Castellaniella sp.]|uniref:CDGSH iron-sulfur domain-containing protein n=1 Tax=Castellaniella sp. TaxID=1955812 RepID=UPI002EF44751